MCNAPPLMFCISGALEMIDSRFQVIAASCSHQRLNKMLLVFSLSQYRDQETANTRLLASIDQQGRSHTCHRVSASAEAPLLLQRSARAW